MATGLENLAVSTRSTYRRLTPQTLISIIRLLDVVSVVGAALIGYFGYVSFYLNGGDSGMIAHYAAAIFVSALMSVSCFEWFGVYRYPTLSLKWLRLDRALLAWCATFGTLLVIAFAVKTTADFSRVWTGGWFLGTGASLGLGRILLRSWIQRSGEANLLTSRTVILGASENGQNVAARLLSGLQNGVESNIQLLGFIDDRKSRIPKDVHGLPILGNSQTLFEMIRRNLVDEVIVALPCTAEVRLRGLFKALSLMPVRVCLVASPITFEFHKRSLVDLAGIPAFTVIDQPISGGDYILKDLEDKILATVALIFAAPLMAIIAAAIKLDSPGPVFFRQPRHGFNDCLFNVWKFRTMFVDQSDLGGARQTTRNDPRITRVGGFLRRSSLDELPQLFNVLLGDMSIVGPRPHPVELKSGDRKFSEIVDRYAARHRVRPGITGWAQVNGWRGETESVEKIEGRVAYDLYYIENWSIWLDLQILVRTIGVVFNDKNAY